MTVSATQAPDLDTLPDEGRVQYHTDEDLPPLRLNATRVPERLSSSTSALQGIRRRSNEWCRSRSRSPSLRETENSSLSSIDTDSDIYTDRMGLEELDLEKMHNRSIQDGSISSLPPVNERLSEDTLEDVHAFSDIKATGSCSSRANSLATGGDVGSLILETLDECDDEDLEAVHISNLDEIHEESEAQNLEDLPNEERPTYFFTTEDLPPFRLNSLRVVDRLSNSHSSFFPDAAAAAAAAGKSAYKPGDPRRGSLPELAKGDSSSSLDCLNQDILTDKMGFQELDLEKTRQMVESMSNSVSSLQPVNERMDQESMDDVHAFSDVHSKASSGHSRANSIATGATGDVGSLLETLEEVEEEQPDDAGGANAGEVHISNLENLTIHENEMNDSSKPSDATT